MWVAGFGRVYDNAFIVHKELQFVHVAKTIKIIVY